MRSCTLLLVVGLLAVSMTATAEDGGSGAPQGLAPAGPALAPGAPIGQIAPEPVATDAEAPIDDPMAAAEPIADPTVEPTGEPVADPMTAAADPIAEAMPSDDAAAEAIDPLLMDAPAPTGADSASAGSADDMLGWDAADEPVAPNDPSDAPTAATGTPTALGPVGVDEHGHRGRIHTVARGDTLWDISTAYLGTPWVWPSVWQDNDDIANPHLIVPGDRIWITAGEMRKVTREQAAEMIAADNEMDRAPEMPAAPAELAEAPDVEQVPAEADPMADDVPAALDQLPVAMPLAAAPSNDTGRAVRVAEREAMGFVASHAVDAATSIVDSPSPRTWLVDGDMIYLGFGEGNVEVGDEFTVFRDAEPVRDVDDGRLLGYHVDIMGWAVVREVQGDSSIAEIRMSHSEIQRGDRVIPRIVPPPTVPVRATPDGIDGKIVYMPGLRTHMGSSDHVYLNRGALHGFEVGSEVEVYTAGRLTKDRVTGDRVMTPDRIDAHMVLVEVKADTAVAYVVHTSRELEIGDSVRPSAKQVAAR